MEESKAETIKAVIERIKYRSPDGFAIGIARLVDTDDNTSFAVKGTIGTISLDTPYELRGGWEEHPRYGLQFAVTSFAMIHPTDLDGISRYLRNNIRWLGPVRSNMLMIKFGERTLEMLRNYPVNVAAEIPGISVEKAMEISIEMKAKQKAERLLVELESIFAGTLITRPILSHVASDWGDDAPKLIRENPYALIEFFKGVGFQMADSVARKLGIKLDDPFRLKAGIIYTIQQSTAQEGHVCFTRLYVTAMAATTLKVEQSKLIPVLDGLVSGLERSPIVEEEGHVYYKETLADEHYIANRVRLMLERPFTKVQPFYGSLKEDQAGALESMARGQTRIYVITGPPGTGKTFLASHIIQSYRAQGLHITLVAPTGKAAKRMQEQTGVEASTIHRALEPLPPNLTGKGHWDFRRNADNPIITDVIICDEASMLDNWLFARMLQAIAPSTMLILIGDVHQLPSVGPGNILKDLISAGVPTTELDSIKRQDAGLIITNCHRIKNGQPIEIPHPDPELDFMFIPRSNEESIASAVVTLLKRIPEYDRLKPLDPINDIQIIVPRRVSVALSCEKLNPILQEALIGKPEQGVFQQGDKVIQCWNDYEHGVMNGDIGRVLDIVGKSIYVRFETPIREVELPLHGNDLELAYAITCHKFQGSEAPVVIVPVHVSGGPRVCQRPWIYTAISRARKLCVLVGQRQEIIEMIRRKGNTTRFTRLQQLLKG